MIVDKFLFAESGLLLSYTCKEEEDPLFLSGRGVGLHEDVEGTEFSYDWLRSRGLPRGITLAPDRDPLLESNDWRMSSYALPCFSSSSLLACSGVIFIQLVLAGRQTCRYRERLSSSYLINLRVSFLCMLLIALIITRPYLHTTRIEP